VAFSLYGSSGVKTELLPCRMDVISTVLMLLHFQIQQKSLFFWGFTLVENLNLIPFFDVLEEH